jgi:hypothetical protein
LGGFVGGYPDPRSISIAGEDRTYCAVMEKHSA